MIKFIIMSSFLLLFLLLLLIIMTSSFYCWNILTHLFISLLKLFSTIANFCSGNNWWLFAIRQVNFIWFWMIFRQVYDSIEWFMVSAPPLSRTAVCSSLSLSHSLATYVTQPIIRSRFSTANYMSHCWWERERAIEWRVQIDWRERLSLSLSLHLSLWSSFY